MVSRKTGVVKFAFPKKNNNLRLHTQHVIQVFKLTRIIVNNKHTVNSTNNRKMCRKVYEINASDI